MRQNIFNIVATNKKMKSMESQENSANICNCNLYQSKLKNLEKKYSNLKRNHKKLLGVAVLLTDALEQLIKGEGKTEINDTLFSCFTTYPDLFENKMSLHAKIPEKSEENKTNSKLVEMTDENCKVYDPATESEKEYFEGFLARPKIPRTPQV